MNTEKYYPHVVGILAFFGMFYIDEHFGTMWFIIIGALATHVCVQHERKVREKTP